MQWWIRRLGAMALGGALVVLLFVAARAFAQESRDADTMNPASVNGTLAVANLISYQGVLLDLQNFPVPSNTYQMTFRLYRDNSTVVWQETQNVVVADGYFSVRLGSVTPLNPDLFVNDQMFLGVQVAGDQEMAPRQPFAQVPYAFVAKRLQQFRSYGVVNSNGSRVNGVGFESSIQSVDGNNAYVIDIKETYNVNDYVTTVSPVFNSDCPFPVVPTVSSAAGRLVIDLFNTSGQRVFCKFQFSVLDLP